MFERFRWQRRHTIALATVFVLQLASDVEQVIPAVRHLLGA